MCCFEGINVSTISTFRLQFFNSKILWKVLLFCKFHVIIIIWCLLFNFGIVKTGGGHSDTARQHLGGDDDFARARHRHQRDHLHVHELPLPRYIVCIIYSITYTIHLHSIRDSCQLLSQLHMDNVIKHAEHMIIFIYLFFQSMVCSACNSHIDWFTLLSFSVSTTSSRQSPSSSTHSLFIIWFCCNAPLHRTSL